MRICINPGHSIEVDPGAVGYNLEEAQVALNIGNYLKPILESIGYEVKLIQDDSLSYVCNSANNWEADLFVSIHCNAFNGVAKGTECLYYPGSTKSKKLSQCIQTKLVNYFKTVDRGIKERPNLYVLNNTDMPATLIETAFIDEYSDNQLLKNRQEEFAKVIAEGIIDYINQVYGTNTQLNDKSVESVLVKDSTPTIDYTDELKRNRQNSNQPVRGITPEDIAEFVSRMLIETGIEGNFDDVTKSSKSDYPSVGISQWLYDRADSILAKIPEGNQFVGKTYSSIVNKGKLYELKKILNSAKGQEVQLAQLKEDCQKYVNDLRQIWYLDDTRCLIYASTWATTSLSTVHKFIEYLRGHTNIRSLLELANSFASQYREYFGVDEKYQLGYSNRAWKVYYAVAAIDLTSKFGISQYPGEFGK